MAIEQNFMGVEKGQDLTLTFYILDKTYNSSGEFVSQQLTTANISTWTCTLEIRVTYGATTQLLQATGSVNNTAKTVTYTIAKADTDDVATGVYEYQSRRTNSGSECVLTRGKIGLGPPPPIGVAA